MTKNNTPRKDDDRKATRPRTKASRREPVSPGHPEVQTEIEERTLEEAGYGYGV